MTIKQKKITGISVVGVVLIAIIVGIGIAVSNSGKKSTPPAEQKQFKIDNREKFAQIENINNAWEYKNNEIPVGIFDQTKVKIKGDIIFNATDKNLNFTFNNDLTINLYSKPAWKQGDVTIGSKEDNKETTTFSVTYVPSTASTASDKHFNLQMSANQPIYTLSSINLTILY